MNLSQYIQERADREAKEKYTPIECSSVSGMLKDPYKNHRIGYKEGAQSIAHMVEDIAVAFAEWLLENTYMNGTVTYMSMIGNKAGYPVEIKELFSIFIDEYLKQVKS